MKVLQNTIISVDTMASQSESSWNTARISVYSYAYRKFVTPLFLKFIISKSPDRGTFDVKNVL